MDAVVQCRQFPDVVLALDYTMPCDPGADVDDAWKRDRCAGRSVELRDLHRNGKLPRLLARCCGFLVTYVKGNHLEHRVIPSDFAGVPFPDFQIPPHLAVQQQQQ